MVETRHEIPSENTRDPAGPQDEGRGPDPKKSRESKKKIGLSGSGGSTKKKTRGGEGGSRTRYFMHAKQALYR
jgi:hypothetical protein